MQEERSPLGLRMTVADTYCYFSLDTDTKGFTLLAFLNQLLLPVKHMGLSKIRILDPNLVCGLGFQSLSEPNFMALLTVRKVSALTEAGKSITFHELAGNFCLCACKLY